MSIFFTLLLIGLLLYILGPLLRLLLRVGAVRREARRSYERQRTEERRQAKRRERDRRSSADILREAQHDLDGGSYVEYEEVEESDRK